MEVIPSFILSPFHRSECQKLSTLTVTNVINPQGHRLHADVAKDSVIKLKHSSQDALTNPQLWRQPAAVSSWLHKSQRTLQLVCVRQRFAEYESFLGTDYVSFTQKAACLCSCSQEQLRVLWEHSHGWSRNETKKVMFESVDLCDLRGEIWNKLLPLYPADEPVAAWLGTRDSTTINRSTDSIILHQLPTIPLNQNSYISTFLPNCTKMYWVFPNPPTKIHPVKFV